MEEEIKKVLIGKLDELGLFVDNISLEKEGNNLFLRICLDGEKLDLNNIVDATKIIDPIVSDTVDSKKLIDGQYILEVYGKSKEDSCEKN